MMTNMAGNMAIQPASHQSPDLVLWMYGAMSHFTKRIRCLLHTNKNDKYAGTVLEMNNAQ